MACLGLCLEDACIALIFKTKRDFFWPFCAAKVAKHVAKTNTRCAHLWETVCSKTQRWKRKMLNLVVLAK